jgi:transcriptional regulator with XRE-family HTH domain
VETFGEAVRRLRTARRMSLRALARQALIDGGHLSRIENNRRGAPDVAIVRKLDDVLDAGGQLTAMLDETRIHDGGLWRPADAERLAAELVADTLTPENATNLAHEWLIAEPPQVTESRSGRRIGMGIVAKDESRVRQLRLLDDHVGGSDTYTLVTAELAATIALLQTRSYAEHIGKRLLVAVGELCQLAGWTTSDAGRYAEAQRIYLLGVSASHAGGDAAGSNSQDLWMS